METFHKSRPNSERDGVGDVYGDPQAHTGGVEIDCRCSGKKTTRG